MSIPASPLDFTLQQGNQQIYLSWAISAGATSYQVQRSLDGVTYTTLGTSVTPDYLDAAPTLGVQYYYQVASVNGNGTSIYTVPQSIVATPSAELSLGELRQRCQERADRVNSQFVTTPEWNFFINQSMYELYDLLITAYEDYFAAPPLAFTFNGSDSSYPLPNGSNYLTNSVAAPSFYKLLGVDLGIASSSNAFVTMNKFNFIDRNRFVYPNTASTIYGVFNLQYRVFGNQIKFIPTPSAGQPAQLWYIPRLTTLLKDSDITELGFSGWLQYVIVRAAKYALDKEESDTSKLDSELLFLKSRIEETAMNRDAGQPDTISDTRQGGGYGSGFGWNGSTAGY